MINIYGKGGHARVVTDVIRLTTQKILHFVEDYNDDDPLMILQWILWVIAIGNNKD